MSYQKNDVDISNKTLAHHINYLHERHESTYQAIAVNSLDLTAIFHEVM